MYNSFLVDIKRYLLTKSLMILIFLIAVVEPITTELIFLFLSKATGNDITVTMNDYTSFYSTISIFLAIIVTVFLYTEIGEGVIRNKLISGKKRYKILLSYCLVNSLLAVFLNVVSLLSTSLIPFIFNIRFEINISQLIHYLFVTILAGVSVSVFYTIIMLCFCTNNIVIAIPSLIDIIMKIVMVIVIDAIYPDNGIPKVSGVSLMIYRGIDRYVPFAYLMGDIRWDDFSYIIGSGIVIVVSIVIGIVVWSKKDLK